MRVGLTGGLGSGKSTVAAMLRARGAHILSADELGRRMMQPGQPVYAEIVRVFGPAVVASDGSLDRARLAHEAFALGRVEELNAIVHPATIARQGELTDAILKQDPAAVVVVESALIFETQHGDRWRERFDRMVLVTAPDELKIERFVQRAGAGDQDALRAEAQRRLARMIPDERKKAECDFVIRNDGSLKNLEQAVDEVWVRLVG